MNQILNKLINWEKYTPHRAWIYLNKFYEIILSTYLRIFLVIALVYKHSIFQNLTLNENSKQHHILPLNIINIENFLNSILYVTYQQF